MCLFEAGSQAQIFELRLISFKQFPITKPSHENAVRVISGYLREHDFAAGREQESRFLQNEADYPVRNVVEESAKEDAIETAEIITATEAPNDLEYVACDVSKDDTPIGFLELQFGETEGLGIEIRENDLAKRIVL